MSKNNSSIAVVIPAFNSADSIQRTLDSVLTQTYQPSEIIVVDDGSTDNTHEVVRLYRDRGVVCIQQANEGSAGARQRGTEFATSDYIAYIDADDVWPRNKLASLKPVLDAGIEFLFSDLERNRAGEILPRNSTFFPRCLEFIQRHKVSDAHPGVSKLRPSAAVDLLLSGFPPYPSTYLVRRSAVLSVGGWDTRFRRSQDFDIALRLAAKFGIYYSNEVGAVLGIHAGNTDANSYVIGQTKGDIFVLETRSKESSDRYYQKKIRRALKDKYLTLAYAAKESGNQELAKSAYRSALGYGGGAHALIRWLAMWAINKLSIPTTMPNN